LTSEKDFKDVNNTVLPIDKAPASSDYAAAIGDYSVDYTEGKETCNTSLSGTHMALHIQ
jgi:hypothetical protein